MLADFFSLSSSVSASFFFGCQMSQNDEEKERESGVLDHLTENFWPKGHLTETPFDRTPFDRIPFDRKFIRPSYESHMTDFFSRKWSFDRIYIDKKIHLTEKKLRTFDRKFIWPKVQLTERSFDRKLFSKNCHFTEWFLLATYGIWGKFWFRIEKN
jgi:hypothetical protein